MNKKFRFAFFALTACAFAAVGLGACSAPKTPLPQGEDENYVDIFIFMGQSNMSGYSNQADEAIPCEEGHGYEFRAVTGNDEDGWLYPIKEPFGITESNTAIEDNRTGGMVSAFCESYYQTTGVPVVGVTASKGGSSITFWQPGTDAYREAVSRLKACKTYLDSQTDMVVRKIAMVWCQGETDAYAAEYNNFDYEGNLKTLYNGLMGEASVSHCFIVTPSIYTDNTIIEHKRKLVERQVALCRNNDNFVLVSRKFENVPLNLRDDPHFCQSVYNVAGWEAGKNAGTYFETGIELNCAEYQEGEAEALAEQFGITITYNPHA